VTDVGNIRLTHVGLSFKITAIKCRDYIAEMQKEKHEIKKIYDKCAYKLLKLQAWMPSYS